MQSFWEDLLHHKSAWVLILANLVPLGGVLFFQWSTFEVVFLFWLENVIIGLFNIAKMLVYGALGAPYDILPKSALERVSMILGTAGFSAFFCVHYGGFCYGHGLFVVALLGKSSGVEIANPRHLPQVAWQMLSGQLAAGALALLTSHGFSFFANYLHGREYSRIQDGAHLMMAPYGRVVVLHLALILGAVAATALGSGVGILVALILGKIILDLFLHLKERDTGVIRFLRKRHPSPS